MEKLDEYGRALASALGDGWGVTHASTYDDGRVYCVRVAHTDARAFFLSVRDDRYRARADTLSEELRALEWSTVDDAPAIGWALTRTPAQAARDVARRLVPQLADVYAKARAMLDRAEAWHHGQAAAVAALNGSGLFSEPLRQRSRRDEITGYVEHGRVKVAGERCTLDLSGLSVVQVIAALRAIGGAASLAEEVAASVRETAPNSGADAIDEITATLQRHGVPDSAISGDEFEPEPPTEPPAVVFAHVGDAPQKPRHLRAVEALGKVAP